MLPCYHLRNLYTLPENSRLLHKSTLAGACQLARQSANGQIEHCQKDQRTAHTRGAVPVTMGKHNGKARTSGVKVGSALVNKAKKVREMHVLAAGGGRMCVRVTLQFCKLVKLLVRTSHPLIEQEGKGSRASNIALGRHTTTDTSNYGMQSVLETNDLNEIMNMVSALSAR